MIDEEPSWDFYRTFLAVMETGSLSGAARELGLTQPTIGRHVDALEAAMGFQLFIRTTQGLMPTEAAIDIEPHAARLATDAAALLRAADGHSPNSGGTVRGTVRVSASEVVGIEVMPPILAVLGEAYPDIVVELSLSDAVEDLSRREADIAVRMAEPIQDALVVKRVGVIPIGLFAHTRYLEAHGVPEQVEDLRRHRMIGSDRQTEFVRTMRRRHPVLDGLQARLKADSNLAQLALIRAGCGIGACQGGLAAREPRLVRVLERDFVLDLETFIAMHEDLRSTPSCRIVFDALVMGMASYIRP